MKRTRSHEDHFNFLKEMIEVQLYCIALRKNSEPKLPITELVNEYCIIINFTDFNDNTMFDIARCNDKQQWEEIVTTIDSIYTHDINPTTFVEKTLPLFENHLSQRVARDMAQLEELYCNERRREASTLLYNAESEGEYMFFHVDNAFYPESFLSYPDIFKIHMKSMVLAAEKAGKKGIRGDTWLNHFTPWLKLFPKEWRNTNEPEPTWFNAHLGLWGQFISPDLTVNKSVVRKLKKENRIPYKRKICMATIEEFKSFLGM